MQLAAIDHQLGLEQWHAQHDIALQGCLEQVGVVLGRLAPFITTSRCRLSCKPLDRLA